MIQVKRLLSSIFPLMALTGLLLAGWGLLVTQDDMKGDAPGSFWGAQTTASLTPDLTPARGSTASAVNGTALE